MNFLILHIPDFFCFYRVIASFLPLFLGIHPAVPWLYSTALLSDLFDGWFFRHYVKGNPAWHPWFPLPVSSIDPLCDFAMMIFGAVYTAYYAFELSLVATLGVALLVLLFSLGLNAIPNLWPWRSEALWTACITTVTHGSCLIMLAVTVGAWYTNSSYWQIGSIVTIAIFYVFYFRIGNRQRLIRHPPADWRH